MPPPVLVAFVVVALSMVMAPAAAQVPELLPPLDKEVLIDGLTDPVSVDVAADGRFVIAERTGRIKVWTPDGGVVVAGRLPVDAANCADCPATKQHHGGISGMALSPEFAEDQTVFVYWTRAGDGDEQTNLRPWVLSRFTLTPDNALLLDSEETLLENEAYWQGAEADGNHRSGDIDFLPDGTMILTTGDDTMPRESGGYAPRDFRPGRDAWNAERTSQNPASRHGALLRLNLDGSVPGLSEDDEAGLMPNPHIDDPAYDPHVYAKGFRQPWRIAIDPANGMILAAIVGPDSSTDDPNRGPAGVEEIEEIPLGGGTNHGWPRCIGDNIPYHDYDFETGQSYGPLSCEGFVPAPVTVSRGLELEQPTMGYGGGALTAGVVYRYDGDGDRALPDAYQGHLFGGDWVRNILYTIPVDHDGRLQPSGLQRIPLDGLAPMQVNKPTDMVVGDDGAIYLTEYGSSSYNSGTGRLSRLQCASCDGATPAHLPPASSPRLSVDGSAVLLLAIATASAVATWRRRRAALI